MEIDYEKEYKKALEQAKKELAVCGSMDCDAARLIFRLFPQLRESEDERMRKAALEGIEYLERDCGWDVIGDIDILDVKEYLEKQKGQPAQSFNQKQFFAKKDSTPFEQELFLSLRAIKETKPSDEEIWLNVKEQLTPVLLSLVQKEQKPNFSEKDSTDFEIEVHEIIAQARNDSRLNDADVLKQFEEEAAFALMLKANKLIEPKPAESISRLTVQGKGVYKICPRCKSRMIRDDSKVYTSMPPKYGYNCPKCGTMEFDTVRYDNPEMEEQKPAEYGDEFIAEAEEYASKVNCGEYKVEVTEAYIAGALRANNKPAEWSEEDRLILDSIIAVVEEWEDTQSDKEKAYYGATTKSDWLKSLRPPQYCENCRLKKSVQGWKPSEEQMEALDKALYYVPEEIGVPIAEIYGHFNKMKKKLM